MARNFSEKTLAEIHQHRRKLLSQYAILQLRLQSRNYKTDRGREYASHGFGRRLGILVRAIDQVFTILPPEREDIPEREEVIDATIAIQAFVLNVVGCLDNLAWVWVYEKDVKKTDGTELNPKSVGLWKTHTQVRDSMSSSFRDFLDSRESWFEHIKGFRDFLAHRVPLYIPPYVIRQSNLDEHNRLELEANAALQRGDHEQCDRLRDDQKKLGEFRPWMTYSRYEQAPTIVFHGQLLSDYTTIDEFGSKMIEELDAQTATQS